ncbi:N-acetyltransferase [Sphingobacterium sp.]|uniref:GNAT family N-acetyltransferase n=1 Tax=Sphingobacterium sp. TaxID=341027 RepID=UPI0028A13E16|nr:N-acetyltransferase [Sphingobacterium sp.]
MNVTIRQERPSDYDEIRELVRKSFENAEFSDGDEHHLVDRLRATDAYVPELALVAENEKRLIGFILCTKITIENGENRYASLALAPVAVDPGFQNSGVGGKLINCMHEHAKKLGFSSIILLGHAEYYPRFGYKPAYTFDIKLPFEVPKENIMAIELSDGALKAIQGTVRYPEAFGI